MKAWISSFCLLLALTSPAAADDVGEEVEVTAGAVTGLACAQAALKTSDLSLLTSCPLVEASREMVVVDVAERRIFRIAGKKVRRFELERAVGGGSIDFVGKVTKIDAKTEIATVEVATYSITRKPKPGAFKGCL